MASDVADGLIRVIGYCGWLMVRIFKKFKKSRFRDKITMFYNSNVM